MNTKRNRRLTVWVLIAAATLGVIITGLAFGELAAVVPFLATLAFTAVALRQLRIEDQLDTIHQQHQAILTMRSIRCNACGRYVTAPTTAELGTYAVAHNLLDCPGSTRPPQTGSDEWLTRVLDEPDQEPQP